MPDQPNYKNPYAYNLPTSFSFTGRGQSGGGSGSNLFHSADPIKYNYDTADGSVTDTDVRGAQAAYNQLTHGDEGSTASEQQALLRKYLGRIGIKNELGQQIAGNAEQEKTQEDILGLANGQALGQGLQNTRQNYNNRGLLYSGMRQSGENRVRGAAAGQLASGLSGTKREYANSLASAKNAYASVDLENQQESLQLAHQAFDTASANNIARLQAMQQLGTGVGAVAGAIAGRARPSATVTPYSPNYDGSMVSDTSRGYLGYTDQDWLRA